MIGHVFSKLLIWWLIAINPSSYPMQKLWFILKMKAATKGVCGGRVSPLAWLSANSYQCKAFGTGALACFVCGHYREKQDNAFCFSSCMLYQNLAWILSHLLENAFKEFQAWATQERALFWFWQCHKNVSRCNYLRS